MSVESMQSTTYSSSSYSETTKKPKLVFFVDVDGVFITDWTDEKAPSGVTKKVYEKAISLFGEKRILADDLCNLEWRVAASYFFSQDAVSHFDALVKKASKAAEVLLVISSEWRRGIIAIKGEEYVDYKSITTEMLKKEVFDRCPFVENIVDKTPSFNGLDKLDAIKEGITSFERSGEIELWLKKHPEIKDFIIFDDVEFLIKSKFPNNFIKIDGEKLFSEINATEAYTLIEKSKIKSTGS